MHFCENSVDLPITGPTPNIILLVRVKSDRNDPGSARSKVVN